MSVNSWAEDSEGDAFAFGVGWVLFGVGWVLFGKVEDGGWAVLVGRRARDSRSR